MAEAGRAPARFVTTAMTMDFELLVDDQLEDVRPIEAEVKAIGVELRSIEAVFSTFQPDSWVSRLNRREVTLADCPPEVADVLALCDHYSVVTDGAFCATLPDGGHDPTGIVKTWAMCQVLPRIEALGLRRWLWGCSGDAVIGGVGVEPWTVGVADPRVARSTGRVVDRVGLDRGRPAIATSGTSEQEGHIWGPAGSVASRLLSATVVGAHLVDCDAWATAIVAGGDETAALACHDGLEVMTIGERDGQLVAHRSPGWPRPVIGRSPGGGIGRAGIC